MLSIEARFAAWEIRKSRPPFFFSKRMERSMDQSNNLAARKTKVIFWRGIALRPGTLKFFWLARNRAFGAKSAWPWIVLTLERRNSNASPGRNAGRREGTIFFHFLPQLLKQCLLVPMRATYHDLGFRPAKIIKSH